jgi:glycine cleavage system H protein
VEKELPHRWPVFLSIRKSNKSFFGGHMNIPSELMYTKTHEWVQVQGDGTLRIGITDHAQKELGEIVFVDLPLEGDTFDAGDEMAVLETQKAASEVYAPVAGEVLAVNEDIVEKPELINVACYNAWLVEIQGTVNGLLSARQYEEFLKSEEN